MTWEEFLTLSHGEQERRGLHALREVVAEAGADYVHYTMCRYTADTDDAMTPNCLIGRVAYKLGAPIELLYKWDCTGSDTAFTGVVRNFKYQSLSPYLIRAFSAAQQAQDERLPWGRALADAEHHLQYAST